MTIPYLIIDGYNLMHEAGITRRSYGPGDLERCRHRLLVELHGRLSSNAQKLATVVFDAFTSATDESRVQAFGELTVVYAPKGTDADSEIERMLLVHSVPKRIVVVSSDHRLHKAAARRKAKCVDSEDFWNGLEGHAFVRPASKQVAEPQPIGDRNLEELEHWLEEFSSSESATTEESSTDGVFDDDYVRKIEEELRRGKLR